MIIFLISETSELHFVIHIVLKQDVINTIVCVNQTLGKIDLVLTLIEYNKLKAASCWEPSVSQ